MRIRDNITLFYLFSFFFSRLEDSGYRTTALSLQSMAARTVTAAVAPLSGWSLEKLGMMAIMKYLFLITAIAGVFSALTVNRSAKHQ